jgi:hypothetical protein
MGQHRAFAPAARSAHRFEPLESFAGLCRRRLLQSLSGVHRAPGRPNQAARSRQRSGPPHESDECGRSSGHFRNRRSDGCGHLLAEKTISFLHTSKNAKLARVGVPRRRFFNSSMDTPPTTPFSVVRKSEGPSMFSPDVDHPCPAK